MNCQAAKRILDLAQNQRRYNRRQLHQALAHTRYCISCRKPFETMASAEEAACIVIPPEQTDAKPLKVV